MRDIPDKIKLARTIMGRAQGLRGRAAAAAYVSWLGTRYVSRRVPLVGRFMRGQEGVSGLSDHGHSDIDRPVGVYRLDLLAHKLTPPEATIDPDRPRTVNFFLPTLDPAFIFGGYIAALNLADALIESGRHVRFIVTEPTLLTAKALRQAAQSHRLLRGLLERSEVLLRRERAKAIAFHPEDDFFSYSWETTRLAMATAERVNQRTVCFLVQEYEPIFFPYDAVHFLAAETYALPHFPVFNSSLLRDYFRINRIGLFRDDPDQAERRHVCFSHAITDIPAPEAPALRSRATRKLLFYARPEAHAGRNLFEIGVMALNAAIDAGVFDQRWEFHGVGSMAIRGGLPLSDGRTLRMTPRMPLEDYQRWLPDHDLGMCLMYAPHPSVPPFEFASAGMPTVTTTFVNKSREALCRISPNLLPSELTVAGLVAALTEARDMADDADLRARGARFPKVTRWGQAFDEAFLNRLPIHPPASHPHARPTGVRT